MPITPEPTLVELAAPGPYETLTVEELLAVTPSPSRRIIRIYLRLENGAELCIPVPAAQVGELRTALEEYPNQDDIPKHPS